MMKLLEPTETAVNRSARHRVQQWLIKERFFLLLIGGALLLAYGLFPYPRVAMWLGFMLAGYSAIANDSIQTVGTFIASNSHRPWWVLWLYIGGILVVTLVVSWWLYEGDVSYQRLSTKGFDRAPTRFAFLQIAAPIFLLVLTRLRMPVSTTFLLLSSFSTRSDTILDVLTKSLSGYLIAFTVALVAWYGLDRTISHRWPGRAHPAWEVAQWLTSGFLWAIWIMQDAANIAIYLPRQLNVGELLAFVGFLFVGLGVLFYLRGDTIQRVVDEKSEVTDIRAATLIDLVYALILLVFQGISTVPMSTTWVFIGLLGGREIALSLARRGELRASGRMARKDIGLAGIGLVVSILIAVTVNPLVQQELRQRWHILTSSVETPSASVNFQRL